MTDSFDGKVVELLSQGGVGLLPTDTIYGLSCRALNRQAVERVHKLKGRDSTKPCIVLISDIKMLDLLNISREQSQAASKYWPGAFSLEFNAPDSPDWLHRGLKHFAIRLPNHAELQRLIDKVGPIISTSANIQGRQPARSADEAQKIFGDNLDFYLDVGELNNPPSTLAVVENGLLKVVRPGAVNIN